MKRMVMALAAAAVLMVGTLAQAGAFGGPQVTYGHIVGANNYVYTTINFRGGQFAEVAIDGYGYTDLDLAVMDEYGNLVAIDNYAGDEAYVSFYVPFNATYTIVVVNHGPVANAFDLANN